MDKQANTVYGPNARKNGEGTTELHYKVVGPDGATAKVVKPAFEAPKVKYDPDNAREIKEAGEEIGLARAKYFADIKAELEGAKLTLASVALAPDPKPKK